MFITIAGIPQWIQIESESPDNPVLLLIHGGPGASTRFASSAWADWRRYFTLVHWDQRGAGRTFAENGPEQSQPMSFNRIVMDGIEVADFLCDHLQTKQIILLGHSWGSAVAVHMLKHRPDLFAAFVGTGMLVNFADNEIENYRLAVQKAEQAGNSEALSTLKQIGSPPYEDSAKLGALRAWSDKLSDGEGDATFPSVTPAGDFSAEDSQALKHGFMFSVQQLYGDLCAIDLPALGPDFEVPMFCLMGTHDQQTPFSLAERYFNTINAPQKAVIPFAGCHHFVHMNRPEQFLEAMVKSVLPCVL